MLIIWRFLLWKQVKFVVQTRNYSISKISIRSFLKSSAIFCINGVTSGCMVSHLIFSPYSVSFLSVIKIGSRTQISSWYSASIVMVFWCMVHLILRYGRWRWRCSFLISCHIFSANTKSEGFCFPRNFWYSTLNVAVMTIFIEQI